MVIGYIGSCDKGVEGYSLCCKVKDGKIELKFIGNGKKVKISGNVI